jgi:hypothetical protein
MTVEVNRCVPRRKRSHAEQMEVLGACRQSQTICIRWERPARSVPDKCSSEGTLATIS